MEAHLKLDAIQGLRAVAALMVVWSHAVYSLVEKAGWSTSHLALADFVGGAGVKVFFAISGFVMIQSSAQKFGQVGAPAHFLKRRLVRIVPLYWLATAVYLAKMLLTGDNVVAIQVVKSLLFIPYENDAGSMHPVYGLGWTLNYEMYFYMFFSISLIYKRILGLVFLGLALSSAVLLGSLIEAGAAKSFGAPVFFWTRPIILYFMVGMSVGLAKDRIAKASWLPAIDFVVLCCLLFLVIGGAIGLFSIGLNSLPLGLLSAGLLVSICCMQVVGSNDSHARRWARRLGDASYSIYLTHSFLVGPLARVHAAIGSNLQTVFIVLGLISASVVGLLSFRYIEQPTIRWLMGDRSTRSS